MTLRHPRQLALNIRLDNAMTLDNFEDAGVEAKAQAVAALRAQSLPVGEQSIYLWGVPGCGISHLLQAACHQAGQCALSSQYLPLLQLRNIEPDLVLDDLDSLDLVCVDDLQCVAGDGNWERALFHFFNDMRDRGRRLVLGSHGNPQQLNWRLADLKSRLLWGLVFQLAALSDEQKAQALRKRAANLGLELHEDVARFILSRFSREPRRLFDSLAELDRASLEEQRRLTIPFVKRVLRI